MLMLESALPALQVTGPSQHLLFGIKSDRGAVGKGLCSGDGRGGSPQFLLPCRQVQRMDPASHICSIEIVRSHCQG